MPASGRKNCPFLRPTGVTVTTTRELLARLRRFLPFGPYWLAPTARPHSSQKVVCKLLKVGMCSNRAAIPRTHSPARRLRICFVGLPNLAVLAPQFDRSGASGEPVQQTLLAKAL